MRINGVLQGLILRKRIAMIFAHKAFGIGPNVRQTPRPTTGDSDRYRSLSESYGDAIRTLETQQSTELLSPLVTWELLEKP
jgi:hypothetical protein